MPPMTSTERQAKKAALSAAYGRRLREAEDHDGPDAIDMLLEILAEHKVLLDDAHTRIAALERHGQQRPFPTVF